MFGFYNSLHMLQKKESFFDKEWELFFSADRKICTDSTVRLYISLGKQKLDIDLLSLQPLLAWTIV